ncbi:tRNA (adenosine(37)-N6)-dimethylallyltransferase MiaA [Alistipes sp. OttesenSCG-928-B03]|nr:tRNA (adenosine(37)-N6)-dimethylallyltransferase MiaA [Alistipes sp. OttesenSCG-928-B03]
MVQKKGTLVVIAGPTGSGKTALAIAVARRFGAPIVSADSRQIFRGMAIGTAQPTADELAQAEHHLIATHDISEHYTCGRYEHDALDLLAQLFARHEVVVAVGGSGLYIDALCYGMDSLPDGDPELRKVLTHRLADEGAESLLAELRELDPVYYEQVDRSNPQRVMRALEVCLQTGRPYSEQRHGRRAERDFNIIKIGTLLPREVLYDRINRRVDDMIASGLEDEARALYPHRELNSLQTVGYRELFEWFAGAISREEAIELIKRNTRRYAKRQMTWFGRQDDIRWFDPARPEEVIRFIEQELPK